MKGKYLVGIDLGTTNTTLAWVEVDSISDDVPPAVHDFPIAQLTKAGTVLEQPSLPSFMYLAKQGELPEGSLDLPWAGGRDFAAGAFARDRGAEVPMRLVSSAKSWLCHGGVDRRAPILPYQAPPEVEKLSPIAAATTYLAHLRDAWNESHPDDELEEQAILLTVPASFDAAARDLTIEAAKGDRNLKAPCASTAASVGAPRSARGLS